MTVEYLEFRVRNSPAGRAKPIHIKNADNSWYGFNNAMEPVINGINNYLKHYRINTFRHITYKVERRTHKNARRAFLQGKIIETEDQIPPSFFKTTEEIIEYLMKYYVGYYIEVFLFGVYKNYIKEHTPVWYADKIILNQYNQRKHLLKEAGIIDLDAEYEKYKATGHSDLGKILYENYHKYLENERFIEDAISNNKHTKNLDTAFELLNFATSFGGMY